MTVLFHLASCPQSSKFVLAGVRISFLSRLTTVLLCVGATASCPCTQEGTLVYAQLSHVVSDAGVNVTVALTCPPFSAAPL